MYQVSLDLAELTDTYVGIRNSDITPTAIYIVSCWHTAKLIIIFTETDKPIAFRLSWLRVPLHLQRYQSIQVTMWAIYRGSYMSVHVLLNLLNKLGKRDKMWGLPSILSLFRNEFNKFNNTGACMLVSIYHMTLRLLWNLISAVKTL